MISASLALIAVAVLAAPTAPVAGATDFTLVNGTGSAMGPVSIRRFRSGSWRTLGVSQGPGGRLPVAFKEEDCLFDIRAEVAAKNNVTWSGVNLCEVEAVILHRDGSGAVWVDYEETSGEESRGGS